MLTRMMVHRRGGGALKIECSLMRAERKEVGIAPRQIFEG